MQSIRTALDRIHRRGHRARHAIGAQARPASRTHSQRGQVLVIYVMSIFVILGLVGIVIDVSWYWTNSLRVQRAADAAALAGAVDLPTKPRHGGSSAGTGIDDAIAEAGKNGYSSLTLGCTGRQRRRARRASAHIQDTGNRQPAGRHDLSAPVQTFFMRLFGIQTITATRTSKALFTLPVPMGSPENYYGVFGDVRNATMTTTTLVPQTRPRRDRREADGGPERRDDRAGGTARGRSPRSEPDARPCPGGRHRRPVAPIYYAQTNTNAATQQWGGFGFLAEGVRDPCPGHVRQPDDRDQHRGPPGPAHRRADHGDCAATRRSGWSCRGAEASTALVHRVNTGTAWEGRSAHHQHHDRRLHPRQQQQHHAVGRACVVLGRLQRTTRTSGSGSLPTRVRIRRAIYLQADQVQVTVYYTSHDDDDRATRPVTTWQRPPTRSKDRVTQCPRRPRGQLLPQRPRRRPGPQPARLLGDAEHPGRGERQRRCIPAVLRHATSTNPATDVSVARATPATTRSTTTTTRIEMPPGTTVAGSTSSTRSSARQRWQ